MKPIAPLLLIFACSAAVCGCRSAGSHRAEADRAAAQIIASAQRRALGRTEAVEIESPADTLRRRLLLDQELPYYSTASLGIHDVPESEYWQPRKHLADRGTNALPGSAAGPLSVDLLGALQIAARNSRDYQQAKEALFRAALDLDLENDAFRHTFAGMLAARFEEDRSRESSGADSRGTAEDTQRVSGDDGIAADAALAGAGGSDEDDLTVRSARGTAELRISRKFLNGIELSGLIAIDLVKLLTQEAGSSLGLLADASISIPLLRGAGRAIVGEPLKQAQQDMLYAVHEFERFKRIFAVRVASEYLGVLRQNQQVRNVEQNYKRLIAAARRARRLADSGRLPEFQFDQAVQDELRARTRWTEARQDYASRVDSFKVLLGFPPDAAMDLETAELSGLAEVTNRLAAAAQEAPHSGRVPPADSPITLEEPQHTSAGPLELDPERAIHLALESRLDLRTSEARIIDATRKVHVAADALRAELTLLGKATAGERRSSAGSASRPDAELRPDRGVYSGLMNLDLPLERTAERNAYRKALIELENAARDLQAREDTVKLEILNALRELQAAREGVRTQRKAVSLAEKRVRSTDMFLQAGRAQIRDVLDSQEALLNAQNALAADVVSYRIAELQLQRDMGVLQVDGSGLWTEYTPEEQE